MNSVYLIWKQPCRLTAQETLLGSWLSVYVEFYLCSCVRLGLPQILSFIPTSQKFPGGQICCAEFPLGVNVEGLARIISLMKHLGIEQKLDIGIYR